MHWLVRRLLWNPETRRPRLPWRLLLGGVLFALLTLVVSTVLRLLLGSALAGVLGASTLGTGVGGSSLLGSVFSITLSTGLVVGGTYLAGRFVDRRRFADFGLRLDAAWWADFAAGAALGVGLMTGIFLVELAAGWVRVTGVAATRGGRAFLPWFLFSAVLFLGVAVTEELLTRGYLLTNLAEGVSGFGPVTPRAAVVTAVVLTSALFGYGHASNPNATAVSTAALVLAGVFLAAGYVLTGELGFPVGLHLTWNFFQGPVYGFPVSGTTSTVTLLTLSQGGPRALTGGPFGPEAGLLGVGAMVVGTALTAWWTARRRGSVDFDPAVWTPDLRWRDGEDDATDAGSVVAGDTDADDHGRTPGGDPTGDATAESASGGRQSDTE